ncbi:MAG TPA: DUF3489 domain-containing protein [Gammaproteobacteria bacterium]|nr:DUF3489 domain-containing protein [Gammaproteobacteria bacterium]
MTKATKLTDTQLVILNAAASRDSHAVLPLPKSLKMNKGAATSVLKALLAKNLVEEQPAAPGAESWRQDGNGRGFALIISETGLAALDDDADAAPKKPTSKKAVQRKGTVLKRRKGQTTQPKGATDGNKKPLRKVETMLMLLQRPEGAQLNELEKATTWQPHSVRAALTGLRKRGVEVTRERNDDVTTYFARVV